MRKIPFAGIELTSQRVRGLRGTSELPGRPASCVVKKKQDYLVCCCLKKKWTHLDLLSIPMRACVRPDDGACSDWFEVSWSKDYGKDACCPRCCSASSSQPCWTLSSRDSVRNPPSSPSWCTWRSPRRQWGRSRLWTTFAVRCGACCTRMTPA